LESERNILHDTVQNLETAIEASQAQLIDARKRLATIERDLEALRASMQLDRGSQP
jgi:predicted  nucleic acid-binding Zn-ribbon protein